MDYKDQEISNQLYRIVGGRNLALKSGKVVAGSIDTDDLTVSVILTSDDNSVAGSESTETDGVLLNSVSMNNNGVILYPADGSDVIVGEVDGPGIYTLIKCSTLLKMVVTVGSSSFTIIDGTIQFNDGSLGGLVVLQKVLDNLNALKNYIKDTLEPAITNGLTAVGVGSAANGPAAGTSFNGDVSAQEITFEDMENTKIKQG